MKILRHYIGADLTGAPRRTICARTFELRSDRDTVAELRFRSFFSSVAIAESADGCWTFRRPSCLRAQAIVRPCVSEDDAAVFVNQQWKNRGIIKQANGPSFRVVMNFLGSKVDVASAAGDLLIRYQSRLNPLNRERVMIIQPAAAGLVELPWLALFGFYLHIAFASGMKRP